VPRKHIEHKEVRVATTVTCYRCNKKGHIARNCEYLPVDVREGQVKRGSGQKSGNGPRGYPSTRR
jgi:hypothetical protein